MVQKKTVSSVRVPLRPCLHCKRLKRLKDVYYRVYKLKF